MTESPQKVLNNYSWAPEENKADRLEENVFNQAGHYYNVK